jgi:hypothetical protein
MIEERYDKMDWKGSDGWMKEAKDGWMDGWMDGSE